MFNMKIPIYFFLIISLGLLFFKKISKNSNNYSFGSSIAIQTYYLYDTPVNGGIWDFIIPNGYRAYVILEEYGKRTPSSEERVDQELWWSVRNFSSATLKRSEAKTISLAGKIGSNLSSSIDIIKTEINAEISASYSQTIQLEVSIREYSSVDVYTYKTLKKVSYMKETIQLQLRSFFWYINFGKPIIRYDEVESYSGISHYLEEHNLR